MLYIKSPHSFSQLMSHWLPGVSAVRIDSLPEIVNKVGVSNWSGCIVCQASLALVCVVVRIIPVFFRQSPKEPQSMADGLALSEEEHHPGIGA